MRLFIAINFDSKTKEKILSAQCKLKQYAKGNFSRVENLHLTLVFLGNIPTEKLDIIKKIMQLITIPILELSFSYVDCFRKRNGDIYWIGLDKNELLIKLQKELSSSLLGAGFRLEQSVYRPHITIGRRVKLYNNFDKAILMPTQFSVKTDSISLMHSHRVNDQLTYTELFSVKSGDDSYIGNK